MKEIETKHGVLLISPFEEVIKTAMVISYNNDFIEIPGTVIFTKGNAGFLNKVLNPGVEIISIDEELFFEMKNAIIAHETNKEIISIESKTKPTKKTLINIDILKKQAVFARIIDDSITVNDIVFTNSETEFHGDGMFTSRKVYFLNFEDLAKVRSLFK
jgi:hypothetical protein